MRYKPVIHLGPAARLGLVEKVEYMIGVEGEPMQVGFRHGPYSKIEYCLNIVPADKRSCIFEMPLKKVLWRWIDEDGEWEKGE